MRYYVSCSLVCLAGLVLVVVAVWATGENSVRAVDMTARSEVTITLTNDGYEPSKLFISRGTRVTFKSDIKRAFWPASAVHPAHAIYPAFDPRRPLEPEEIWSFVFEKDGRWDFHDHLYATETGAIVVIPPGEKADKKWDVLAQCGEYDPEGKKSCWENHIIDALETSGLDGAFDELKRLRIADSSFGDVCHTYAHEIGLLSFKKYGDNPPLSEKAGYCNDGFFHGYLEGFLGKHQNPKDARVFCDRVAKKFKTTYPSAGSQCNHGIGHGTADYLLVTRPDLWSDLPQIAHMAATACAETNSEETERFRCASGAYDVLAKWARLQKRYADSFSIDNPYVLCRKDAESWDREACVREMSKLAVLRASNFDIKKTFAIIEQQKLFPPGSAGLAHMIEGSANLYAGRSGSNSNTDLVATCRLLHGRENQSACIRGVVGGLFLKGVPGEEVGRVTRFCLNGSLEERERALCAQTFIQNLRNSYEPEKAIEACSVLSDASPSLSAFCSPAMVRK